jgi:hypothetical protein
MLNKFFALGLSLNVFVAFTAQAEIECDLKALSAKYLPKLKESAEWPDSELLPYAKQLCALDQKKEDLQKQVNTSAAYWRKENPAHTCVDLSPAEPDPDKEFSDDDCTKAYNAKVNAFIDACKDVMTVGHNPHNVMIDIDAARVEIVCLRSALVFLKANENFLKKAAGK